MRQQVAFFSAITYNSIISGRTKQLALSIARLGHEVFFVEMPGLRNCKLIPFRQRIAEHGIKVITLPPFPLSYRLMDSPVGRLWRGLATWYLRRVIDIPNSHCVVSTPWWAELVSGLRAATINYDCIDHFSVHCRENQQQTMARWEQQLIKCSSHIFYICKNLHELHGAAIAGKQFSFVPNGVPNEWLKLRFLDKSGTRPKIGFIGALYEWIDIDLLTESARALPDMDFLLVGPRHRNVKLTKLENIPNIKFYPAVEFAKVPETIAGFDVGLIPFKQDLIADCADPLKLYEYLALGKPVVSSVSFNSDAPVFNAVHRSDFIAKIKEAFEQRKENIDLRRSFAEKYTWQRQADKMLESLAMSDGVD
jgi:glycosyltransferase involved in cell wall biosynthesis